MLQSKTAYWKWPSLTIRTTKTNKIARKAHIILINGKKDINFEKKVLAINNKLEILYTEYKPLNINEFKNKKLMAFAGIGKSKQFLSFA